MHLNMVYRRRKALNNAEMVVVLLLGLFKVTNSDNITWYGSNMTLTRSVVSSDYFDLWNDKDTKDCSLRIQPNVCQSYGALEAKTNCKKSCCVRCVCGSDRSTFLVRKQQCVQDSNVTRLSGSDQLHFDTSAGSTCTNSLPTIDMKTPWNKTFSVCMNGVLINPEEITKCSLLYNNHSTVDSWEGINPLPKQVKNNFKMDKKLQLKWIGAGVKSVRATIVSIAVKCTIELLLGPSSFREIPVTSRLYFKVAGSHTSPGPQIFYRVNKAVNIPTKPTTTSTVSTTATITTSTTSDDRSKLNVVHVPGKADMLLVIIAGILGSLLVLVICMAIIMMVVFRRRQMLNISGKHTSNPTYERGPDQTLMQNGHTTLSLKSHFYQPLVENTRDPSCKEPIYESLDDNLRERNMTLTENPNRCSLAYCDVTSDGYLIPTDGPAPPVCPRNTDPSPITENTTRPRLSSSYDEPEVILKERKPKLKVELPSDEKAKSFYHELEENGLSKEEEQNNETVTDNCKSPTENTYLELIGEETNGPLESEML